MKKAYMAVAVMVSIVMNVRVAYCQSFTRGVVAGKYERDLTEGWINVTRPDGTRMEIIPGPKNIEYLSLKRTGKYRIHFVDARFPGKGKSPVSKGHWAMKEDTVVLFHTATIILEDSSRVVNWEEEFIFTANCYLMSVNPLGSFKRTKPPCKREE